VPPSRLALTWGISVDLDQSLYLALAAAGASVLGSMLGLGGGVFIVPLFTLFLGVDPKIAVGASAIAVVTNSVVGSTRHLRNRYVNIRLSMLLEISTALGAILGALIAVAVSAGFLEALLGAVLLYAAWSMLRGRKVEIANAEPGDSDPMELMAEFPEGKSGNVVRYVPQRLPFGIGASAGAGVISGMLGIGGGVVQVPLMNLLMKIPLRAAAGTSSFMVGMTAVATASVFYASGNINPQVTVPAMIGVLLGSNIGSILTKRLKTDRLVVVFVVVMVYLGISMVLSAFGIEFPG
jgi:uncharacterized membrane protein YfcA